MKKEFLRFIEKIRTTEVSQAPNYKTMLAIAKHPEAYYPNPEEVAAHIRINVNETFVNDPELFETTVDAYVKCFTRIYDQIKIDFPHQDIRVFNAYMSSMDLSLTYTA